MLRSAFHTRRSELSATYLKGIFAGAENVKGDKTQYFHLSSVFNILGMCVMKRPTYSNSSIYGEDHDLHNEPGVINPIMETDQITIRKKRIEEGSSLLRSHDPE